MNLPGLSLLGYDSLVTQWGPLEQARRPKEIDQKIREAEKHIEALREAIKGGAGSLPDIREAYDSALKVVHGIGSTHPRWGRQIADKLYKTVSSGNDVRSLAEELRDMRLHEPRINPIPRKGVRGGGHSDEDRAAWEAHKEEFYQGLPTEVQQHETPDDMEKPEGSAESTSIANPLASGGRIEPRVIDVQPSKEPEKPAAKSEKPAQDAAAAAAEEGQPRPRVKFLNPHAAPEGYERPQRDVASEKKKKKKKKKDASEPEAAPAGGAGGGRGPTDPPSVDVADPPSSKGGNGGGGGSVPPSEPSTAAGGGMGSERDRRVIAAYERLFPPTEDASKTYKARWANPSDIKASDKVFHQPGKNPVNRYTQVLGNIYTRLMGTAQNTTLDEIRNGDPRGTHAKRMRTLRSIYSQIAEADRPKLDDVHRAFIYKVSPLLDEAGASEGSVMADSPVMKDIFHTVVSHTIGDADYDPEHDYIAPLRTGRERRKEWEAKLGVQEPTAPPKPQPPNKPQPPVGPTELGLQDPPKGPEQPPQAEEPVGPQQPSRKENPSIFDVIADKQQPDKDEDAGSPADEEPQAGDRAQQPAAEGEDLHKIEAPAPEVPEQQPQQPQFAKPKPQQRPSRLFGDPGGGRSERMGIPQADWGRQPAAPPLGAPEWAPRPELPNWGPEPVRLPEPPTAEGNEAQPRQSPFSGAARKPVSLPYRPWSKPAPTEEPPESSVEERWEGLKSGERKFTAAQPMWKNLPRKPVSLPYSPWGKSGGPELPPDEEGSGSSRPRNPKPLLTDPSRYSWSEPKEGPKPYDATEDETSSDYRADYRASGGRVSGGEDESPWSRFYNKADKFFSRLSGDAKFERSPDSQPRRSSRWARSSRAPIQLPMEAPPPKPIQREGGWTPANRPASDSFGRQTLIEVSRRPQPEPEAPAPEEKQEPISIPKWLQPGPETPPQEERQEPGPEPEAPAQPEEARRPKAMASVWDQPMPPLRMKPSTGMRLDPKKFDTGRPDLTPPPRFATTMALRNKAAQRAKPTMSPQGKPIPRWLDRRRANLRNQDLASMMEMMLQQMRTTRWKRDDTTRTGGVAPVNTPAAAPIPSQPNEQPSLLALARSGPTSYQYGQAPNIEGDIRTARALNKQTPPESAKLRYSDPIGDSTPAARTGDSINAEDTGEGKRSTADTMNDQSVKRPKFKKVAKEASLL